MTAIRVLEQERTVELVFAGDKVRLAGQIDYPNTPPPPNGYPLIFIIHHAGGNTREAYQHYVDLGLSAGYAVFRWDKRGTGRSGAGGQGSATQDAVNAYEIALEQPNINRQRTVIIAQCSGTLLLGSSYGLFARIQNPYGVLLVGNKLDEKAILAIDTRVHIVMGENDWIPAKQYAVAASKAHNAAYPYGALYYVAAHADRMLLDTRSQTYTFHQDAQRVIFHWLDQLCPTSRSV